MAGGATLTGLEDCVDRFWEGVYLTLVVVFDSSVHLAERYRRQFESTPTRRLMLAYNATPLQVAADLSQFEEVTDEQSELYQRRVVPFLTGVQTASDGDRFLMRVA